MRRWRGSHRAIRVACAPRCCCWKPAAGCCERTLEQVSIQEICAQAGVTTGAFYSRFEGKDSYFRALQALVLATLRKGMAEPLAQLHPADASPELELRIRFAHQALAGTLLYALINRDSTFALSDRRLDMEMARAFLLYVA
ncbi:TetR family transcriptional regulator [Cupriavidus necator]